MGKTITLLHARHSLRLLNESAASADPSSSGGTPRSSSDSLHSSNDELADPSSRSGGTPRSSADALYSSADPSSSGGGNSVRLRRTADYSSSDSLHSSLHSSNDSFSGDFSRSPESAPFPFSENLSPPESQEGVYDYSQEGLVVVSFEERQRLREEQEQEQERHADPLELPPLPEQLPASDGEEEITLAQVAILDVIAAVRRGVPGFRLCSTEAGRRANKNGLRHFSTGRGRGKKSSQGGVCRGWGEPAVVRRGEAAWTGGGGGFSLRWDSRAVNQVHQELLGGGGDEQEEQLFDGGDEEEQLFDGGDGEEKGSEDDGREEQGCEVCSDDEEQGFEVCSDGEEQAFEVCSDGEEQGEFPGAPEQGGSDGEEQAFEVCGDGEENEVFGGEEGAFGVWSHAQQAFGRSAKAKEAAKDERSRPY